MVLNSTNFVTGDRDLADYLADELKIRYEMDTRRSGGLGYKFHGIDSERLERALRQYGSSIGLPGRPAFYADAPIEEQVMCV